MAAANTSVKWRVTRDTSAEWSQRLRTRVTIETETYANNVLAEAQASVRVRTGATRESGTVQQIGEDPVKFAVTFLGAALYLEYGTVHHPAYPFLRPAAMAVLNQYLARLAITTQGRIRSTGMSMSMAGVDSTGGAAP